jgi:calcium/calmodulin-dependent protein kinase I
MSSAPSSCYFGSSRNDTDCSIAVSNMLNKLHGQPDSYDRKFAPLRDSAGGKHAEYIDSRSRYRFGKTLGAGTYGIVREADCPEGKVAVKIILKKNVRGNEQMVYDELEMLQRMRHPHIVKFHDWFESRVGQLEMHSSGRS